VEKKKKSISITRYDYVISSLHDEELDIQGHPHHYSEYDPDGHPLKETRYNRLGEFEEMVEYGYDDQGNVVRESYYPAENELAEEKTYTRNETGQINRALKHYQDGSIDTITFEYNDSGKLIKCVTTSDEGEIEEIETFEWEDDVLVHHQITDENGNILPEPDDDQIKPNESRITRNEQGLVITEEELDENGEVFMTVNRSYDADGQADEVDVYFDGQGKAISRHYVLKYAYTYFG
jgi:hypothetical protein